jgi:hypothetical protein
LVPQRVAITDGEATIGLGAWFFAITSSMEIADTDKTRATSTIIRRFCFYIFNNYNLNLEFKSILTSVEGQVINDGPVAFKKKGVVIKPELSLKSH